MEKANETYETGSELSAEQLNAVSDSRQTVRETIGDPSDGSWTMLPEEWTAHARQKNIY